jgi:hypothetical protein
MARLVEFLTNDTSSQLASEGVPHSVFNFGRDRSTILALLRVLHGNALLSVDLETSSSVKTLQRHALLGMSYLDAGGQAASEQLH